MKIPAYRAFISYSHSDERWASWLHRALESYRVPRKLVGIETPAGEVPRQIRPIFRDRDDLSSASDLSTTVKETLANSENLILLCSPKAAASPWVNEEIREFVRLGKQAQIFCIVIDGDPASTEAGTACFPPALAEAGLHEPLAADVRDWADGKYLAKLKLVAGLLGLPLDQLRRRDLQKRRKFQVLTTIAAVFVLAIIIAAAWFQASSQQRRDSGELLVAVKLNELRTLLKVSEDPEELRLLADWSEQDLASLIHSAGTDKAALIESAMELRKQGQQQRREGAIEEAIEAFKKSWALIAASYRSDRTDLSVFFELGQAEYWIGQMYLDRRELDRAEHFFTSYAEITRRLILLQPQNDEWVLEMSYALTNLGMVQRFRRVSDPVRALQIMQSALEYNQIALVLDPTSTYYRSELGQSNANLADAQRGLCDLEGALESQQENVTLQSELFREDSASIRRMLHLAFALSGHALIQQMMGQQGESKAEYERSLQLLEVVLVQKPGDHIRRRQVLERKQRLAWLDALAGNTDRAWVASNALTEQWQDLVPESESDDVSKMEAYAVYLLNSDWIVHARGDQELAEERAVETMALLDALVTRLPDNRYLGNLLTRAAFQYWEIRDELPSQSTLGSLPDYAANSGRTRACVDADMAVRKAIMQDDMARAEALTTYLLDHGYLEPSFIKVCKLYSLCPEL